MKLKKAKIIVRSLSDIKAEWKKAMKGKIAHLQKDDEIIFTNLESITKVFSKTRIEILITIIHEKPQSIYELAKILNRDFKNVHSDVKLLAEIGLIKLQESGDARHGLIPIAKFSGIELDLAA